MEMFLCFWSPVKIFFTFLTEFVFTDLLLLCQSIHFPLRGPGRRYERVNTLIPSECFWYFSQLNQGFTFLFSSRNPVEQLLHLAHSWRHSNIWISMLVLAHWLPSVLPHRGLHQDSFPRWNLQLLVAISLCCYFLGYILDNISASTLL